jgi:glycosyltransferase involved in cell wall biosynthesis
MTGGAELSSDRLVRTAPDWAEIVYCPPDRRPPSVEAFVVQNCITYDARWLEPLASVPVIKSVRDPWNLGDVKVRRYILDNAALLDFNSQLQIDLFRLPFSAPHRLIPPPLDLKRFEDAAKAVGKTRVGNVYVGRVDTAKGGYLLLDWALRTGEPLDVFGSVGQIDAQLMGELPPNVRMHGPIPYDQVPTVLARARRFVFFPLGHESFGRTVAEAWAAGCELLVRGQIGAFEWLEKRPEMVGRGAEMFWAAVGEVLCD